MLGYQLLWAYRRFLRPSSPLDAKTSTVCPYSSAVNPTPQLTSNLKWLPTLRLMLALADLTASPCVSFDFRLSFLIFKRSLIFQIYYSIQPQNTSTDPAWSLLTVQRRLPPF